MAPRRRHAFALIRRLGDRWHRSHRLGSAGTGEEEHGGRATADETRRRRGRRLLLIPRTVRPRRRGRPLAGPPGSSDVPDRGISDPATDGTGWRCALRLWRRPHRPSAADRPPKGLLDPASTTRPGRVAPVGWTQSGFVGKLELDHPLVGESDVVLDVPLIKGRPKTVLHVRAGKRVTT